MGYIERITIIYTTVLLYEEENPMPVKYVFVTGGVVSGLGKGITAASLGRLLKARGYKVTMQKFDPYINIDPGTMNPIQHGEVFVTDDGAETDLDLGHYERFIDESLTKNSNVTTGKVYWSVLQKERRGRFRRRYRTRSSLTSQTRSRAASTGTLLPRRHTLPSLKSAVRSAISKVSRSSRQSVSSSMK